MILILCDNEINNTMYTWLLEVKANFKEYM